MVVYKRSVKCVVTLDFNEVNLSKKPPGHHHSCINLIISFYIINTNKVIPITKTLLAASSHMKQTFQLGIIHILDAAKVHLNTVLTHMSPAVRSKTSSLIH